MTSAAVHMKPAGFEQYYPLLREKEGRVYSDEEVLQLPDITKNHPYYDEWQIRKESCNRLKHYFEKRKAPLKILEVGCGNGWLSCRLAEIPGSKVTGADINFAEIQQAVRVFNHIPDLQFIHGGINAEELEDTQYDFIAFCASIQYFSSLKEIISQAMRKLKPNGEIHIFDTNFYAPAEISAAKERSARHFSDLGFPEMTNHYFHHSTEELNLFRVEFLYLPSLIKKILNNKSPFPWLCIKKQ
jgi:ubiquinone/menaquinone biosynthesis C-methylase UbiE